MWKKISLICLLVILLPTLCFGGRNPNGLHTFFALGTSETWGGSILETGAHWIGWLEAADQFGLNGWTTTNLRYGDKTDITSTLQNDLSQADINHWRVLNSVNVATCTPASNCSTNGVENPVGYLYVGIDKIPTGTEHIVIGFSRRDMWAGGDATDYDAVGWDTAMFDDYTSFLQDIPTYIPGVKLSIMTMLVANTGNTDPPDFDYNSWGALGDDDPTFALGELAGDSSNFNEWHAIAIVQGKIWADRFDLKVADIRNAGLALQSRENGWIERMQPKDGLHIGVDARERMHYLNVVRPELRKVTGASQIRTVGGGL